MRGGSGPSCLALFRPARGPEMRYGYARAFVGAALKIFALQALNSARLARFCRKHGAFMWVYVGFCGCFRGGLLCVFMWVTLSAGAKAPGPTPATPTPSGGPASRPRWLATPRPPPRPRGGENRAGERVPPLFVLEPTGPAGQRTKRTFFVPVGTEPCWYPRGAVWERVQRTQGRFTFIAYTIAQCRVSI